MNGHADPLMTSEEYLAFEEASTERHEYFRGRIFALSGASDEHDAIVINVSGNLYTQLRRRPCRVFSSDVKIKAERMALYTYPDATVVCGKPIFEDAARTVLLNPTVIFEVLSPSTEKYDRGKKFQYYRSIPSLQEYVLVACDMRHIEHYIRQDNGTWQFSSASAESPTLTLPSIGCVLELDDVYEKVEFPDDGSDSGASGNFGQTSASTKKSIQERPR